jgi:hypothetical protein
MHPRADSEVRNQLTLREATKMKYHHALARFQENLLKKKQVAQLSAKDMRAAMADYKKIYAFYCNLFRKGQVPNGPRWRAGGYEISGGSTKEGTES